MPNFFKFIIKYVTPLFLLAVFAGSLPDIITKISNPANGYVTAARIGLLGLYSGICYVVYIAYKKRVREGRFH